MRSLLAPAPRTKGAAADSLLPTNIPPSDSTSIGLSKVTGMKSLNIELTWRCVLHSPRADDNELLLDEAHTKVLPSIRPFVSEESVPTHEAMADAENLGIDALPGAGTDSHAPKQEDIDKYVGHITQDDLSAAKDAFEKGEDEVVRGAEGVRPADPVVLTREERRRVMRRRKSEGHMVMSTESDWEDEEAKEGEENISTTALELAESVRPLPGDTHIEYPHQRLTRPRPDASSFASGSIGVFSSRAPVDALVLDDYDNLDFTASISGTSRVINLQPRLQKIARWDEGVEECAGIPMDIDRQDELFLAESHPTGTDFGVLEPMFDQTSELAPERPDSAPLPLPDKATAQNPYLTPSASEDKEEGGASRGLVKASTFSARRDLKGFMEIRGRAVASDDRPSSPPFEEEEEVVERSIEQRDSPPPAPQTIPDELLDEDILILPQTWDPSTTVHRYIASVSFIQKHAIAARLRSLFAVELVERSCLESDVDLILDPQTAIVYFVLAELPSRVEELVERLSRLSWRYERLVVVFEGYTPSRSYFADGSQNNFALNPFPPPVMKAVKKMRRGLGIAEGVGGKSSSASVRFGYALSVDEAAMFARAVGDVLEREAVEMGADDACLWDNRMWLGEDGIEVSVILDISRVCIRSPSDPRTSRSDCSPV